MDFQRRLINMSKYLGTLSLALLQLCDSGPGLLSQVSICTMKSGARPSLTLGHPRQVAPGLGHLEGSEGEFCEQLDKA